MNANYDNWRNLWIYRFRASVVNTNQRAKEWILTVSKSLHMKFKTFFLRVFNVSSQQPNNKHSCPNLFLSFVQWITFIHIYFFSLRFVLELVEFKNYSNCIQFLVEHVQHALAYIRTRNANHFQMKFSFVWGNFCIFKIFTVNFYISWPTTEFYKGLQIRMRIFVKQKNRCGLDF